MASAQDEAARQFKDVLIIVSLWSETDPDRIRKLMPDGCIGWVNEVTRAAGLTPTVQQTDAAHWLVCADRDLRVVHLGYFAFPEGPSMLPWDLLTPEERRRTPRNG